MSEDCQLLRRVQHSLIAICKDRISPWGRHTVHVRLPEWPIRSASGLWAPAVPQRLIDQDLDFRFEHRGIFVSKLPLKGGTDGRDVPFAGLSRALTGLLMQCLAFLGRESASWVRSLAGLFGTPAQKGEGQRPGLWPFTIG